MKSLEQQLRSDDEEDIKKDEQDGVNIDVLDIMDSLKDQYENLEEKYKNYRAGKAKYKTGKLANDVQDNKSIFDYMSPKSKRVIQDDEGSDAKKSTNEES